MRDDGTDRPAAAGADPADAPVTRLRAWLLARPRLEKRVVLVALDFLLLAGVLWASLSLRRGYVYFPETQIETLLLLAGPVITLCTFGWFGVYKLVTRYMGSRGTTKILMCVALSTLVWGMLVFMSGQNNVPRSSILTYGLFGALGIWGSRQLAGVFLKTVGIRVPKFHDHRVPVVIYGAGPAGQQLRQALRNSDREVIGFVDPSESMWGQYIGPTKVYRPDKLDRLIERDAVKEVLLALPPDQRQLRRQVLKELESKAIAVKIMPAIEDIAAGRVAVTDLRPVDVVDLLGRDPVPPIPTLLTRNISGKSILVTGAGGSVGSELVRQILRCAPSRLVLLDLSEAALYLIAMEVEEAVGAFAPGVPRPDIVSVLGSVLDAGLVADVLQRHQVDTIYHAAAYKHVPIVEHNPVIGLLNNTHGAAVVAKAARDHGVERVVLISTDKAVRPTNVMGASKRLAEMVLQAAAAEGGPTVFTMVRFGNVLDSSGSVVRRFRKQIRAGGPVTVTHPDITRYFMSIPEAAELVIQAGAMATGGEVFVLDMGEPVKILELARLMIRLTGLEVRDAEHPEGDIPIVFTGLRPGEKLYEELLIASGNVTSPTEHPRIMRCDEPFLPAKDLAKELDTLRAAMATRDTDAIQAVLVRTVDGYTPEGRGGQAATTDAAQRGVWGGSTRTIH